MKQAPQGTCCPHQITDRAHSPSTCFGSMALPISEGSCLSAASMQGFMPASVWRPNSRSLVHCPGRQYSTLGVCRGITNSTESVHHLPVEQGSQAVHRATPTSSVKQGTCDVDYTASFQAEPGPPHDITRQLQSFTVAAELLVLSCQLKSITHTQYVDTTQNWRASHTTVVCCRL